MISRLAPHCGGQRRETTSMGFLDRIFKKRSAGTSAVEADRARSQTLAGRETGQTMDEQAATRGRMEAELDAQRERRNQPPTASV
jgi:hypothetical protein